MKKISQTQKLIIIELYTGSASSEGERLYTYKLLEKELKFNHRTLKLAITKLRNANLVTHSPAIDEDGRPCGSGFMLTKSGDDIAITFEECKDY